MNNRKVFKLHIGNPDWAFLDARMGETIKSCESNRYGSISYG